MYNFPVIFAQNLTKSYENGAIHALKGIDLIINRGEFVSIIGPSGSGKSTLLNMLGGLDKPTSGTILIDGIDITKADDLSELRSEKIGFIFQLHNLIPNLSVVDNVQIPLLATDANEKEMKATAKYLLESVGLGDKLKKNPNTLSGGQRQRVAVARALVNNPSIILADEPTGSLDTKTGHMILDLLKEIQKQNGVTLIIVTHDNEVAAMADRTIQIRDGEIIEDKLNNPNRKGYSQYGKIPSQNEVYPAQNKVYPEVTTYSREKVNPIGEIGLEDNITSIRETIPQEIAPRREQIQKSPVYSQEEEYPDIQRQESINQKRQEPAYPDIQRQEPAYKKRQLSPEEELIMKEIENSDNWIYPEKEDELINANSEYEKIKKETIEDYLDSID